MEVKRKNTSMDGFVTRRPHRTLLNERTWEKADTSIGHMRSDTRNNASLHTGDAHQEKEMNTNGGDIKQSIGESLREIDVDVDHKREKKHKKHKRRRIAKIASLILGIIIILIVGFLLYKAWQMGSRVFKGDMLGIFQQQELKTDEHGRSNLLILGSTDDMPGRNGANLTDSMMVLSVDQKKKDAYMFSIPRDLWVKYNKGCVSGYEGKINAFYACEGGEADEAVEKIRMDSSKKFVGDLFGMDIQYVAHVNTTVIRDSVNAVGGITVGVQSRDERGVLDSTFDDMCGAAPNLCPRGHYLDFKNGPNDMNGDQAMAFSQARGMTPPTYGLEESNFDREKNQQLVLMALKEKAASSGTLTDIGKVMGLMDAMGNNLRTDVDPKEVQAIMRLGTELDSSKIHRLSFNEEDNRLLTTDMVSGQSVVRPIAGLYDYSEIRAYIRKNIYATEVSREAAKIVVLNGGAVSGAAQLESDKLEELGMNIVLIDNAPESTYGRYTAYSLIGNELKTATRKKLEELYGPIKNNDASTLNLTVEADFVIILGPVVDSEQ